MTINDDALVYDIESRSQLDLKKVGSYRYAADKSTKIMCVGFAINDDPIGLWVPGDPVPKVVKRHIERGGLCYAFNASFERQMHEQILGPHHGWPTPELNQFRCLMAMSLALALPGSLEDATEAMGIEDGKDKVGKRVMLQLTKPRKARKGEDPNEVHWHNDEGKLAQLYQYCKKDVEVERKLLDVLWPLNLEEQAVWFMDQVINDRGFYVDEKLLLAMREIITAAGIDINAQILKKTNGAVTTVDEVQNIKTWLKNEHNIEIVSLSKTTIPDLIADKKTPPVVREVLELRMAGAQAAVKKVNAFLERRSADGRVRGAFIYHAAGTGRFASRGAQVHNLKRLITEEQEEIASAVDDLMTGDYKLLKTKYARPLQVVGDNIRTCITAAPGNVLIGADFSGVEARVTAWLAGETRKLKVFTDYDAGKGPDPYIVTAADIFNISVGEVTKAQRQVGKGAELAFGFQGGVNAYKKFQPTGSLAILVGRTAKIQDKGVRGEEPRRDYFGLEIKTELTEEEEMEQIDKIKMTWRRKHPNIERLWHSFSNAAKRIAIKANQIDDGADIEIEPQQVKSLWFEYQDKFMFIVLPSGRRISYPFIGRTKRYRDKFFIEKPDDVPDENGKPMYLDSFFMDNSSGRWHRLFLYGGLICENIVQGVARDLLTEAMKRIEAAGFPIVAHVHDECVIEVSKKIATKVIKEFSRLMVQLPIWAQANEEDNIPELPVVAKAWSALRYVK